MTQTMDAAPSRPKKVRLWRTLLVAAVVGVVLLAVNIAVTFFTEQLPLGSWIAAAVVAVVSALIDAVKQSVVDPVDPVPHQQRRGGASLAAAFMVVIVVVGGGGWAVAVGVRYATGWISGNEEGAERLAKSVSSEADGLTMTVHSVKQTSHFVRVEVTVESELANSLSLPLQGNATLTSKGMRSLRADAFRSDWTDTIAAQGESTGVINFPGQLEPSVKTITLSFATVFEQGFDGPSSLTVKRVKLKAP